MRCNCFGPKGINQSDVRDFIGDTATLQRFGLFGMCLKQALPEDVSQELLEIKTEMLLCFLNGISHNLITISSYPWIDCNVLVSEAVSGIVGNPAS